MSKDDYPPVVQGVHSGLSIEPPAPLIYTWADAGRRIVELEKQSADARKEIERLESDGKALRTLISQFDAAIRRIAASPLASAKLLADIAALRTLVPEGGATTHRHRMKP